VRRRGNRKCGSTRLMTSAADWNSSASRQISIKIQLKRHFKRPRRAPLDQRAPPPRSSSRAMQPAPSSSSSGCGRRGAVGAFAFGRQGASSKDHSLRQPREHHEFNSWVFSLRRYGRKQLNSRRASSAKSIDCWKHITFAPDNSSRRRVWLPTSRNARLNASQYSRLRFGLPIDARHA